MRTRTRIFFALTILSTALAFGVRAESSAPGYVDFGKLTPSKSGGEFVEVQIRSNLISMVARLIEKTEPTIADLLRGLHHIRVNVISLNDDNRDEIEKRIKTIRAELEAGGWERVVTVLDGKDEIGAFIKLRNEEAVEGVAITVLSGKSEAVLVNIVGNIRPEKIAVIAEKLNIEPLKMIGRELDRELN